MRLLIIQPTHYYSPSDMRLHKTKSRALMPLTLPYLASLTPKEWKVRLLDEQLEDVDFNAPVDAVAITTWTINSIRAYEIADRFRERGIPVMMGGPHIYFHAEEALKHCDAVCIGEGEYVWKRMLEDCAAGRLKQIYRADKFHDMKGLPFPKYELVRHKLKYGFIKTYSVQTSRGCPFRCEFCSERYYLGTSYRYRPVEEVVEEIKRIGAKYIFFADSNFAGKVSHTMELIEALIPLKIRWSTLWSVNLCKNDKLMDLAKRSGLLHVNIGIESIDRETLKAMNKRQNKASEYREILLKLRKRGISYSLNFIFGWDTETLDIFDSTLQFLMENKVPVAYFNILTPHKGTPLYERMKQEGRIINIDDIGRWPGIKCYIKPTYCTPEELEDRIKDMYKRFYSISSIFKRLPLPITQANIASWIINMSQRRIAFSDTAENFDAF